MAITCTPENLMSLSECFLCLTEDQRDAIKTYLLAVIAGGSTDPETLMASAACFTCLTPKQLKMLQPYLMCLIANAAAPAGDCENVEGDGDPGAATPDFIGQVYTDTATGNIWRANSTTPGDWTLEVQNMQVQWLPTSVNAGEFIGFIINADTGTNPLTTFRFLGTSSIFGFTFEDDSVISHLEFPNLIQIDPDNFVSGQITADNMGSLLDVDLSSLVTAGHGLAIRNNPLLTSIIIGNYLPTNGKSQDFSGNALPAANVNTILARGVANAGFVSGDLFLSGGTNAAPSGQGIADKATLIGRGVNVITN